MAIQLAKLILIIMIIHLIMKIHFVDYETVKAVCYNDENDQNTEPNRNFHAKNCDR